MTSRADSQWWPAAGAPSQGVAGGGPAGFEVGTDELARFARVLAETTDVLLRAEDTGRTGAVVDVKEARPGVAAARPVLVPGWLHDHDRRWRALRDGVLHGHVGAVQALRETAHAYLDGESRAVQLLTIPAAAVPGLPVPQLDQPRQLPARAAEGGGFPYPVDPTGLAGSRLTDGGDALETAVELWRRRRDSGGMAVELLRQQLTDLRWQGPAAAAFTSWMYSDLDRCAALADRAEAVHTALTRTDLAIDPEVPPVARRPTIMA